MRTYHSHSGVPIGSQTCWDDQKHASKPTLPSYLRQIFPNHRLHALYRLRLSGYSLNIERLWREQNRVPYVLRICTKCNWHCVQDKEHVLSDCLSNYLANLRFKHHHIFCNPSKSLNGLGDFTSQADTKSLALFVHECLEFLIECCDEFSLKC